jgi:competence protein ComEC
MVFKSEIIFVRILFPFILGILLSYVCRSQYLLPVDALFAFVIFVFLLAINLRYKQLKTSRYKPVIAGLITIFWFFFGGLISLANSMELRETYFGAQPSRCLKAWVSNEPQLKEGIWRAELTIVNSYHQYKPKVATGKLMIALKSDSVKPIHLAYGDELLVSGNILPVEPGYNPGEFDFKAWLAAKNIYHQVFLNQVQVYQLLHKSGNPIIKYAINIRKRQVDIYRKLIRNDEAFAVASTLVLGYRADLSKETLAAYSKTGTIHALSVSGMHVGIIYIFLNWALFFLDRNRLLKIIKLVFICTLIWYYSMLTGFSPSVLRSAVMLTVYILAKAFNKNSNSYNILSFTAFCLLCYDPFLILDVGFQLSFLAVFGLIYLQPKIYNWFYFKNKWADKLWATIALSLAAQVTTFPLSIYYFHQFPIYFIFSNLFILLPLTLMMYLGIGILMLRLYFLAPIFEWIITFTNNGLKWIANLPFSGITAIWIDVWQLILLSLALSIFVLAVVNYKKSLLLTAFVLFVIFQGLGSYSELIAFKQKKILFFSLRKNYAAAFIDGKKAILITDLTIGDKNYGFFVKPALEKLRIASVVFIKWRQDTVVHSFAKKEQQISFHHYRLLLVDERLNFKKIMSLPKFDVVWLHQYSKKSVLDLRSEVLFSKLIIDASIRDYLITRYEQEANKVDVPFYTLKKKNSYLIELKK